MPWLKKRMKGVRSNELPAVDPNTDLLVSEKVSAEGSSRPAVTGDGKEYPCFCALVHNESFLCLSCFEPTLR